MKKRILPLIMALTIITNGLTVFAELGKEEDLQDKITIEKEDDKENKAYKKLFSVSELNLYMNEDIYMVPLRPIAESLGFQVDWDKDLRQVNISKDAMSASLKADENYYMVARKSPIKLSKSPEIKDSETYVPIEFFIDILKHKLIIVGDDLAIIMDKKEDEEKEEFLRLEGYVKSINKVNEDISILIGIEDSDIKLNDIYVHLVEESIILNGENEEISGEEIKIGSKVRATTPRMMTMSLPPQTTGKEIIVEEFIEIEEKDKEGIKYPELTFKENKVVESYFQQSVLEFVEEMESNKLFKDLRLDYMITYLDAETISIIFRGTYDFIGQDREVIKTLNLDLKNGAIIEFENYFKTDRESQKKLKTILDEATKIQHNKEFVAESLELYFTEDFLVLFYYETSDSETIPTEIYLRYKDIKDIINTDIGKVESK